MRKLWVWLLGGVFGVTLSLAVKDATANRNSSGIYSLPNPPVATGNTISSNWANTTLNDIGTEITNSLDRAGRSAMTGPLKLNTGAGATAPDLQWLLESNTGLYRGGAGDIRLAVGGIDVQKWSSTTSTFPLGWTSSATNTTSLSGTASATTQFDLVPSLAAGNTANLVLGAANTANNAAAFSYTSNATAANSQACIGVVGHPGTVCTDGNAKVYLGESATGFTKVVRGSATVGGSLITNGNAATFIVFTNASIPASAPCSFNVVPQTGITTAEQNVQWMCFTDSSHNCNVKISNNSGGSLTPTSTTASCTVTIP